ncbi:hypothetical protein H4Q26_011960 [Puccinia striiformis f. sp. tritici PST-130]|nr:hypothetical protein H4Q26_011960 [Puccinia striiformis f. sp. tritici PST-130]
MSPDNALNIPALRRSGSGASLSTLADSRKTQSSTLHTSQTAQQSGCRRQCRPPLSCASKFAKICKWLGAHWRQHHTQQSPLVPLDLDLNSIFNLQPGRQPNYLLGTHSTVSFQTNSRLPQSSNIPAPNRKRRTSSSSSTEVQKQLTKALDKLSRTQEECTHWKTRAEEVRLWIEQCEKDQYKERISFCEEIKQLEDQHAQTVQQIKNNLGAQLTRAQEEIENLLTSTAKYQEDLQRLNDQVDRLNSKVKQMDIDFGHSAAQAMELTRVKTELKIRLEASQSELDQNIRANQNRVNQVSEHYHNIQSKLHQDLEQMTAEYQASLEKQEHSPSPEFFNQLKSKTNQLEQKIKSQEIEFCKSQAEVNRLLQSTSQNEKEKCDLKTQLSRAKQQQMNSSPTIPHESYAETLENLKNTEAELKNLKSELKSVNGSIADQQKSAYDTEKEQTTAQIALRDEFESVQTGLKTQLSCAQQAIEDMRSSTVPLENHEKILKDLKTLESELSSLKSELLSSQETCQVASNNLNSSQQTIHVLEDSLRNGSIFRIDWTLAGGPQKLNNVHAQTLSKLDELSAFNPQQSQSSLHVYARNKMKANHQILQEATAERNTLVVAALTLQSALKSWKQRHPLTITRSPKENDPQAYKTALDQIDLLTKRLDDLKEQLIQTHMAHEEQEKLALHDTETIHSQLHLSKEQHSQAEEQQAHVIASRELQAKLSGAIQNRSTVDEKYQRLENQIEEPLEKTRAPEEENRSLNNKLEVATEEQQANKEKTATDLSRTKEQLTEAISARDSLSKQLDQMNQDVRLLTEKLEQLCSEEELVKQSSEKYQTLLSEFKALGEQLPALFSELEVVRSELESATGMVKDMTSEVKEKDSIIDQLEADLATANKLQGSVSSSDNPMTMEQVRELEEEDAEEQQLLNLVEMLKIKLKSRTKSTILSSEQRAPQESSEDPPRVEPSSSAPEPDDQSASSSSRKQKHEPTNSDIAGTRLKIQINDDKNDAKENPSGTNGRQPIRRKISANRDEEDCQDDLNSKTDEIRNDSIGVLKPVSVNQQSNIPCTTTTESAREYSKYPIFETQTTATKTTTTQQAISVQAARIGGTTTNSAGAGASKVQMDEPRRSSLRLVRKDQENP